MISVSPYQVADGNGVSIGHIKWLQKWYLTIDCETFDEAQEKKALILAAADLLHALETFSDVQGIGSSASEYWAWIDKARAAIDKARDVK
jgi:hypothetical protein